jgi:hypothetical protein
MKKLKFSKNTNFYIIFTVIYIKFSDENEFFSTVFTNIHLKSVLFAKHAKKDT